MENVKLEQPNSKGHHRSKRSSAREKDNAVAGPSWLDTNTLLDSSTSNCKELYSESDYHLSLELKERLTLAQSKKTESSVVVDNNISLLNGTTSKVTGDHSDDNLVDEIPESITSNNCESSDNVSRNDEVPTDSSPIEYVQYESELQMPLIMKIIQKDLSEPYSIYTYRYFIHNWPKLCFLAMCGDKCVGAIVCKLDMHRKVTSRGYIAMLAVDQDYRKRSIGSTLVKRAIREMICGGADEVVLETEVTNKPALRLYEALGFVRDKRLFRYYLNGVDALRLKLWLR